MRVWGFFPRLVRLVKQGLPALRGRAGLRASSSGKWLTAYIYHLPDPTVAPVRWIRCTREQIASFNVHFYEPCVFYFELYDDGIIHTDDESKVERNHDSYLINAIHQLFPTRILDKITPLISKIRNTLRGSERIRS